MLVSFLGGDLAQYELVCPGCRARADELEPRSCKLCGAILKQEIKPIDMDYFNNNVDEIVVPAKDLLF